MQLCLFTACLVAELVEASVYGPTDESMAEAMRKCNAIRHELVDHATKHDCYRF
jgi:hypothetical protein